jgi:hypothetical protein
MLGEKWHENASFSGVWRQTAWSWSVIHNQTLLVRIINAVLLAGKYRNVASALSSSNEKAEKCFEGLRGFIDNSSESEVFCMSFLPDVNFLGKNNNYSAYVL